jgi:hypothetical protein
MKPTNVASIDVSTIDDRRKGDRRIDDRRIDDRRIDDRRQAVTDRRKSLRLKALKGAQIILRNSAPLACIVRNISETGAKLEVYGPVLQNAFDLVFDLDHSRRSCCVVWRKEPMLGVKFL